MAKRYGVLEADEPLSAEPQKHVSKTVAKYLVRKMLAVPVGPRVIQMLKARAAEVGDTIRDVIVGFWPGPLGVGNLIPFAKSSNGDKLHYEVPHAGDRGIAARHRRKFIRVSGRLAPELRALAAY
jgi:hypothetical protein